MSIREENINKIIEMFNGGEEVTIAYIQEQLDLKERAAKGYIRSLKDYGINIKCSKGVYYIKDGQDNIGSGAISKSNLRELKIINIVSESNGKLKRNDIISRFKEGIEAEDCVSDKTIIRDIKKCCDIDYIYEENERFYIKKHVRFLHRYHEDDYYRFIGLSGAYSNKMPFHEELKELRERIIKEGNHMDGSYTIFSIGRGYKDKFGINTFLANIDHIKYKENVIYVEYNSAREGLMKEYVHVITFLYSWDKDKGYIIGKVGGNTYFIDVDTIIEVKEIQERNIYFEKKEYMEQIKLMFGASLDKCCYKVKVEFDNKFNIKEKLLRLAENRGNGKVHIGDDISTIIYEDTIYGIQDFANYLRRFGSSCRVIEPPQLKSMMMNTYERMLKNYEVTSDEQSI